jgi:acyl-CoA reductase-like NAD-dependent aldehyde dehydrogenase
MVESDTESMYTRYLVAGTERSGAAHASVTSPYDNSHVGEVALAGPDDVALAVAAASAALESAYSAAARAAVLDAAGAILLERAEDVAQLICGEVGKPITLARTEVARAVNTLQFSAAAARMHSGRGVAIDAAPAGVNKIAYTMTVPIGVVAAITPFNFPLNLVAHKLAPAIAAGCPVILKPAPQAPLTALAFAHILLDAGLRPDYLSVLPGGVHEVAEPLIADERIAAITFTGSTRVGWHIRAQAPRKKVLLELGNSAPVIVHADANLPMAAEKIVSGSFSYAGQSCVSVQRVYAHESIAPELVAQLLERIRVLGVGDPRAEGTVVGPVIDDAASARIVSWVDDALAGGARLVTGGEASGRIIAPTLVMDAPAGCALEQQEVFGPVLSLNSYSALAEAFARANGTRFALQAGIFTSSLSTALSASQQLKFGGVLVNEVPTFRTDGMPYGGGKDSGNTREGPASTVAELTDERLIVFDHQML